MIYIYLYIYCFVWSFFDPLPVLSRSSSIFPQSFFCCSHGISSKKRVTTDIHLNPSGHDAFDSYSFIDVKFWCVSWGIDLENDPHHRKDPNTSHGEKTTTIRPCWMDVIVGARNFSSMRAKKLWANLDQQHYLYLDHIFRAVISALLTAHLLWKYPVLYCKA